LSDAQKTERARNAKDTALEMLSVSLGSDCSLGRIRTSDLAVTQNPAVSRGRGLSLRHSPAGLRRRAHSLWTFPDLRPGLAADCRGDNTP